MSENALKYARLKACVEIFPSRQMLLSQQIMEAESKCNRLHRDYHELIEEHEINKNEMQRLASIDPEIDVKANTPSTL